LSKKEVLKMNMKKRMAIKRREFLKKTAAVAAGIALIGMAPGFAWAGKKPIKIGASISLMSIVWATAWERGTSPIRSRA
jgi:transketolase C-terminal domain/subunit